MDVLANTLSMMTSPYLITDDTLFGKATIGAPEVDPRFVEWCRDNPQHTYPYGEPHTRAVHNLPVLIDGVDADGATVDRDAARDALNAELAPGSTLTVINDGTARVTRVIGMTVAEHVFGEMTELLYTLECDPYWDGTRASAVLDVTDNNAGVLSATIPGDAPARAEHLMVGRQASALLAFGIFHEPGEDYDPHADVNGTATTGALSGQATVDNSGNATYADIANATFDTFAHEGDALAIVRAKVASGSANLRAVYSAAGGGSLTADEATDATSASALTTTLKEHVFGPKRYPPSALPMASGSDIGLGTEATLFSATTGTDYTGAANREFAQTFTLSARTLITEVIIKAAVSTGAWAHVHIKDTVAGVPVDTNDRYIGQIENTGAAAVVSLGGNGYVLNPGTYAVSVTVASSAYNLVIARDAAAGASGGVGYTRATSGAGAWSAGDGSDSTVDYYLVVKGQTITTYASGITVQASGTGQAVSVDTVTLMPVSGGAFLETTALSAGQGVAVQATGPHIRVYKYARDFSTEEVGYAAWGADFDLLGPPPRPWPGVNAFVALWGNSDGSTPTGGRYELIYTPRYFSPFGV